MNDAAPLLMQTLERFQIEIGMRILSSPQSKLFALG